MGIHIEPYSAKFEKDVIKCLKRNFNWMQSRNDKEIKSWMEPLWNYKWANGSLDNEFTHGVVILNSDAKVVGYLGFIFSLRFYENQKYKYLSPSYWAIDEKYRFYLFQVLKKVFKNVDVIGDFTAIPSVEQVLKTIFKFKTIGDELYQFLPVPYLGRSKIEIHWNKSNELPVLEQKELLDHEIYGVKCAQINTKTVDENTLVFYRVFNASIKRRIPVKCVQVLKVTNPSLFTRYAHEIIWKIQYREKSLLQCDSIFFNSRVEHPLKRTKKIVRQFLIKPYLSQNIRPDFLYSELAILNDKTGKHYLL